MSKPNPNPAPTFRPLPSWAPTTTTTTSTTPSPTTESAASGNATSDNLTGVNDTYVADWVANHIESSSLRQLIGALFILSFVASLLLHFLYMLAILRSSVLRRRPAYLVMASLFLAEFLQAVLVLPLEALGYTQDDKLHTSVCSAQAVLRAWALSNIFCSSAMLAIFLLIDFCRPNWHKPWTARFYTLGSVILLAWLVPIIPALSFTLPARFRSEVYACAIYRTEEFYLALLLFFPITVVIVCCFLLKVAYERLFHPYPRPKAQHVMPVLVLQHQANETAFLMLLVHHLLLLLSYVLPEIIMHFLEDDDDCDSVAFMGSIMHGTRTAFSAVLVVVINDELRSVVKSPYSRTEQIDPDTSSVSPSDAVISQQRRSDSNDKDALVITDDKLPPLTGGGDA